MKNKLIEELVAEFSQQRPLRAKSVIVTFYGDAVAPYGGSASLSGLIHLLAPLGINERLVRTTVFRLAKDNWLTSMQIGRRSYYNLTDVVRRRFAKIFKHIYAAPDSIKWDEQWRLVFATSNNLSPTENELLQRELSWLGFGIIAPYIFAHPTIQLDSINGLLSEFGLLDKVVLMQAKTDGLPYSQSVLDLVRSSWDLETLAQDYNAFLSKFRPILWDLQTDCHLDPEDCFLVRTLMIHEYRRILLRDPQLPDELLPVNWEGSSARLLCRNLYRLIYKSSEQHLRLHLDTVDGPLPEAAAHFYTRFGGLL